MTFNNDTLAQMSAKAVSEYITKGVPLTDAVAGLSKQASLNLEQTKRLVETTNQVAYLKLLKEASDRTFEFPVASYDDVVSQIVGIEKAASAATSATVDPLSLVLKSPAEMEKTASFDEGVEAWIEKAAEEQLVPFMAPILYGYKAEFEKLAMDMESIGEKLLPLIDSLRKDEYVGEKLTKQASVHTSVLEGLVGVKAAAADGYTFNRLEMQKIAEVDSLISEYQKKEARADFVREEMEKLSFMAISGRLAGSVFGKTANGVSRATNAKLFSTGDVNVKNAGSVVRGYQGYPGSLSKSAAVGTSSAGLPQPGAPAQIPTVAPTSTKPSFVKGVKEKWNQGLISKLIPKNKTMLQRAERVATIADYGLMRETIAPSHSVWDSLHKQGETQ